MGMIYIRGYNSILTSVQAPEISSYVQQLDVLLEQAIDYPSKDALYQMKDNTNISIISFLIIKHKMLCSFFMGNPVIQLGTGLGTFTHLLLKLS